MDTSTAEPVSTKAATALRHADDLPGPRGLPLLGNALQLGGSQLHRQFEAWAEQYGPYYKLKVGPQQVVVVGDHEVVARVLRDRPDGFKRTSRQQELWLEMGLNPGLFGSNGESWQRQRRMVMAAFAPEHVRRYFPAMTAVAQRLSGRWQRAAAQGSAIDLQSDLMRYTVDTIAGLAFGEEVNTLESDGDVIQQHLDKIFPTLFARIIQPIPLWRWFRTASVRQLERAVVEVSAAVDGFVAKARERLAAEPERREQPHNLLEAMIVAADLPDSGIDDRLVAGNVLTMLLAGEDTTANTLAWMIHLLWRHPFALARATEEVRRVCGRGPLTLEMMGQLDYVEACAHETMRLKPVAPQLPLQTVHEVTLGDVKIPADRVVISLLRRDSVSDAHVPNAAAFEPERWLQGGTPGQTASAAKRISMPFGAGPRICPGRYLALLEMKVAMAMLLGTFDIRAVDTPDGGEAREKLAFTMAPEGLTMKLALRAD